VVVQLILLVLTVLLPRELGLELLLQVLLEGLLLQGKGECAGQRRHAARQAHAVIAFVAASPTVAEAAREGIVDVAAAAATVAVSVSVPADYSRAVDPHIRGRRQARAYA
jgi:hypothetical protein